MKKLKLDDLRVESFDTASDQDESKTELAYSGRTPCLKTYLVEPYCQGY